MTAQQSPATSPSKRQRPGKRHASPAARKTSGHPLLRQLADWYPQLFGEPARPLKRGIYADLLAAHPEGLEQDALKAALAQHTRSTRYLVNVAAGQARHDLQGQPVEAMAHEHVLHALIEVHRRRQARGDEDLAPKLRQRIAQAFDASGLSREDYAALLHTRDAAIQQLFDEALDEAAARAAKDEALHRAYSASGLDAAAFAERYGMPTGEVRRMLDRVARRAR